MNGLDYISPDNHIIIQIIPKIYFEHFWICEGGVREDDAPSGNQILFKQSDLKSDLPRFFVSPVFQSGFPHIWYSTTRLRFICNKNSSQMDPNCCKAHFEQLTFKCAPCCVTVWFLSRICLFLGSLFQLRLHLVAYLQN